MRDLLTDRVCDHTFITSFLRPAPTVLDLGANQGEFSRHLLEYYGANVFAAEPVPQLFKHLPDHPSLKAWPVAIAAKTGPVTLYVNQRNCATLERSLREEDALHVEVQGVSLTEFIDRYVGSGVFLDLVKLDIEGAEVNALEATGEEIFRQIGMLTVEFHDFCAPLMIDPVRHCMKWMESQGFYRIRWSLHNSDVLFVNRSHHPLTSFDRARLIGIKWSHGLGRKLRHLVSGSFT